MSGDCCCLDFAVPSMDSHKVFADVAEGQIQSNRTSFGEDKEETSSSVDSN